MELVLLHPGSTNNPLLNTLRKWKSSDWNLKDIRKSQAGTVDSEATFQIKNSELSFVMEKSGQEVEIAATYMENRLRIIKILYPNGFLKMDEAVFDDLK